MIDDLACGPSFRGPDVPTIPENGARKRGQKKGPVSQSRNIKLHVRDPVVYARSCDHAQGGGKRRRPK